MKISRTKMKFIVFVSVLAMSSGLSSLAFSDQRLDHCNKVLEGDLFNKVLKQNSNIETKKKTAWSMFLHMTEDEAFNTFQSFYQSTKNQGSGGAVEFLKIALGGNHDYSRGITEEQFRQEFRKMRELNKSSSSSDTSSRTAKISNLSMVTRDEASIRAWEKCVSQDKLPGLYAYGSRRESGQAFIKVIWVPGDFGGSMPNVTVDFAVPDGVTIKNLNKDGRAKINIGGGRAFVVESEEPDKAIEIFVNANVPDKFDDTYETIIPSTRTVEMKFPDGTSQPVPQISEPKGEGILSIGQSIEEFRERGGRMRMGPAIGNKSTDSGSKINPRGKIN
ncbi:hypothetical protein [Candidatus Nitrospira nitrificans]|uniref:Uncharacterized protein n=1 Tax=Candidatus Nitrospira nitrificans TaxID=1742973 RepID=A0A0S4LFD2_9BACT|nr:hypothetical protein [Candidatus Nitrospira nitrificans]CUS36289.1 exported hypothetical protein [Candidatus Nitrospira nitrificans]